MKILVLARDGISTWMLVNSLLAKYPSLIVCLEKPIPRDKYLLNRIRRLGVNKVLGQILFLIYLLTLRSFYRAKILKIIDSSGHCVERPNNLEIFEFDSVNSKECQDWLATQSPDVAIINGTRILSSKTLSCCRAMFLNIHCGITPQYRGVHGGYWALANGDVSNAGVTVHLVDAGIDTGDVIYQQSIDFKNRDNFLIYPIRQYITGIPLLIKAIEDIANKKLTPKTRGGYPSNIWYHPTILEYIKNIIRRQVW